MADDPLPALPALPEAHEIGAENGSGLRCGR